MDKKDFKKALEDVLSQYGFKYYNKEKTYYHHSDGLIVAVDVQKSNFADYYYINYGFRIVGQDNEVKFPKVYNGCDIQLRFIFEHDGERTDNIHIDVLDKESFYELAKQFIEAKVFPVMSNGITELFKVDPDAVSYFKLRGKRLLGIPE